MYNEYIIIIIKIRTRNNQHKQYPQAIQTTEIAKEVAPFIKDILGKGQALYKQRMEEGFVPFEGKHLLMLLLTS